MEWKTAKVQNHSVAPYYLSTQMIDPLFDMFTAAVFIFISREFLDISYPLWQPGPPGLAKSGFSLSSNMYVSWIERDKILTSQL